MSDTSPGPGWWQASDSKWYPPELHPSVREAAAREAAEAAAAAGDTAAPARRIWAGGSNTPLYRRVWFVALAAVVGLAVAMIVYPVPKATTGGSAGGAATTAVTSPPAALTTTSVSTLPSAVPTSVVPTTAASTGGAAQCTATISNPSPAAGAGEIIRVTSNVPNAAVAATIYYETTTAQYPGTSDGSGNATISFGIGPATVGDTVTITVTVGTAATCTTSFTPQ